jgi:hypothetical protein
LREVPARTSPSRVQARVGAIDREDAMTHLDIVLHALLIVERIWIHARSWRLL